MRRPPPAFDLARRLEQHGRHGAHAGELSELANQIAADRAELTKILGILGVKSSRVKIVAARVGGWISGLKPNGKPLAYSALDRLIDFETLSVGIVGKRALWRSLTVAGGADPALVGVDLERLLASADEQFGRVERLRLEAAEESLAGDHHA